MRVIQCYHIWYCSVLFYRFYNPGSAQASPVVPPVLLAVALPAVPCWGSRSRSRGPESQHTSPTTRVLEEKKEEGGDVRGIPLNIHELIDFTH